MFENSFVWAVLITFCFSFAFGLKAGAYFKARHMETAAIERGCALRHKITGDFTWKADLGKEE